MTALNDFQRQTIRSGLLDVHRRLAEMESMLAQSLIDSPFTSYINDLSPAERKVIQDYFGRIRESIRTCLRESDLPLEGRRTSLRWALRGGLMFLEAAVAEFAAERLRGYGELTAEGRVQAERIQRELRRWIERALVYLRQGLGENLEQRLARLDAAPGDAKHLALLHDIITRRGLIEFQPLLDQIVWRMEAPRFEIAVFGRVSSGKSSLLNHIAGMVLLPVGVVPITAVPTRLMRGEPVRAAIAFAEWEPRTVPVAQLYEYASEEGNPANRKHVTGIEVFAPSPRLREGVVWVDTPGIGSLALSGSAETFAYLPRCDLGVVLIDAASTINADDVNLLRLLAEAGVPVQVLLSKADLLTPPQRQQAAEYVHAQIQQHLGLDVAVHPVSIVGADEALLYQWFECEIEPLLARSRALAEQSLRRKIAHVRESVIATLENLASKDSLSRDREGAEASTAPSRSRLGSLLEEAEESIRTARKRCRDWTADEPSLFQNVFARAAQALVSSANRGEDAAVSGAAKEILEQRGQTARRLVLDLQQYLGSTLESLRQADSAVQADISAIRDITFVGLPPPEIPPVDGATDIGPPWWTALLPNLAVRSTQRRLDEALGPTLREQVGLRDRQIHAWLKQSLATLIESYENQAEIFRARVQRVNEPAEDASGVIEDLQSLQAGSVSDG
jgi:GTP-binding protein EngB required for normal cell division